MGTLSGVRHPLFFHAPPYTTPPATLEGSGPGEPLGALRCGGSFHQFRGPFWKAGGLFLMGRLAPSERAKAAVSSNYRASGRHETTRPPIPKSRVTSRVQDRGSQHVAPLRPWTR